MQNDSNSFEAIELRQKLNKPAPMAQIHKKVDRNIIPTQRESKTLIKFGSLRNEESTRVNNMLGDQSPFALDDDGPDRAHSSLSNTQ